MSSEEEYKPFVYTPFFRRFTDERARDIAETKALYTSVRARYLSSPYAADDAIKDFVLRIAAEHLSYDLPCYVEFCVAMDGILRMEDSIFGFAEVNLNHISLKEQVDLNRYLRSKDYFFAHEQKIIESFEKALKLIFLHIAGMLPKTLSPSPFVIPLAFALPEPKKLIDDLYGTLWKDEYKNNGLFVNLTRRMYFNMCEVSGISDPEEPKKPFIHASKNTAPLAEIFHDYLKETPFEEFFTAPLPLQLTHEERYAHFHLLGGTSAGKTQMLQQLILHDLTSDNCPALVIVDSQGDLISKLLNLDLPNDPILISPKDTPALNVFDVRDRGYGEYEKEQVTAGVIQTLEYLFTGFGIELTGKMQSLFRPMCRLMLTLPETMGRNATLLDIIHFTDKPEDYLKAIEALPDIQRSIFERDILDPKRNIYKETREQIRYRLQALLDNPTLARLFSSPETKLDIFAELNNQGSVILVDTDKAFLKGASGHFGRIFISLVLQAVLERAVIPEDKRTPAFLIVDEAAQYFDSNIDDLLTEARKYKCGLVLAHQFLDQCKPQLRASLAANTAIKMAGGVSTGDARMMAPEMRTTSEFILGQPKLHFACHIRNVTPQAVSIPVKAGELEKQPKRSDLKLLMARNRERVTSRAPTTAPQKEEISTLDHGTNPASDW